MKKLLRILLGLALIAFLPPQRARAQESLLTEISYPFLEKLIALAKQNYPTVKIRQHQVSFAQNSLKIARLAWFDAISMSYVYDPSKAINVATPNLFSGYQAVISLNLGNIIKTPLNVRAARENYNVALLEQQDYLLTLEADVKTRYITYISRVQVMRLRVKAMQDALYMLNESKHQFERGAETVDNYTKANTNYTDNIQAKIDAEASMLIAKTSLEEIIGKKLEDVK